MDICLTKDYGYCYGVKRAVDALESAIRDSKSPVYCFGYIIHNRLINESLEARGVIFTENIEEIPDGATLYIRAHGIPEKTEKALRERFNVIDMTCPNVLRIHRIAKESDKLIVFGDPKHPEVIGIVGCCNGHCLVLSSVDDVDRILATAQGDGYTMVSQTTAMASAYKEALDLLTRAGIVNKSFNTICGATGVRQKQVEELATTCDAFIIVGGKNSSNSKKLYEIALSHCKAFHIENYMQLPIEQIDGKQRIGLSSGTSTPAEAIEEVICKMVNENEINQVEGIVTSEQEEFLQAMEGSIRIVRRGYRVKGIVTVINGTEIQVDLGGKHSGIIPAAEFINDEEPVKVGDEIEAVVVKVDDQEGTALLSKKEIDSMKNLEKVRTAFENGEKLTVKVTDVVKGGLLANVNGVRVFIPGSQVSMRKNAKLEEYPGKEVTLKIINFEENKRRVVGSIRVVLEEERAKAAEELWGSLEVGQRREGVVTSVCDFGAFVNIGGADGLVHVTDLTWGRREKPADIVKVGQEVTVIVKNFNPETKKISLTMKLPEENPWTRVTEEFNVGDIIEVTILRLTPYGAFVSVVPGADGLIHISQIAHSRVNNINDALAVGQKVNVKIMEIDTENKKIALSIKETLEAPEETEEVAEEEPAAEATEE